MGKKLRKWGHAAGEKKTFFYSNSDFAACESHGKELWGGLTTNPKKTHPALVIPELTLLGKAELSAQHLSGLCRCLNMDFGVDERHLQLWGVF